jgi:hypothetical protein
MGDATSRPRITSADLAALLGIINTRLTVIEGTIERLDRALNGNGKPGLLEDHRCLQSIVNSHLKADEETQNARTLLAQETKEAKELLAKDSKEAKEMLAKEVREQRDRISGRTWAVVLCVIGVVVTNAAALLVLFIRTGGIR